MTNTLLVTPENWFDLARLAALADAGTTLEFTLAGAHGHRPLSDVSLGELRAVHHTVGSWWADLGADTRPASVPAGAWDRLRTESRALLREQAEAALAAQASPADPVPARLAFPAPGHPLLSSSSAATAFLTHFLWLPHSPSLLAWAQRLAAAADAVAAAREHSWMRLLFQKVAVEHDLPEALACLREAYGADDAARRELLRDDAALLQACELGDLAAWSRRLGLHVPARTEVGIEVPPRRLAPPGAPPDITVLVPSYCHAAYIEAALESVLAQTYTAFRVLVVDDRSPDATVARAGHVTDPRLRVEVNETNLGLGDSVLAALERIDTPYVALLNSDDLFHPERLERCRDALERSPAVQVVATGVVPVDADGRGLTVGNVRRLFDGRHVADWIQWYADTSRVAPDADLLGALLERNFLVTSSNIVARTGFLKRSAHALRGLKYCLDWQIFLEAAAEGALVALPDALLGYRLHASNTVWFDEERGAAYALEVNRVLAHSLRHCGLRTTPGTRGEVVRLVNLLTHHAVRHSEANGLAMYANDLVGGPRLEAARAQSADVRGWLRALWPRYGGGAAGHHDPRAIAATALAEVAKEEAAAQRDRLRWQQAERDAADDRVTTLEAAAAAHAQEVSRLRAEADASAAAHARELQQLRHDLAGAHAEDLHRLRTSPEWLVGDRLWNRAGGSRVGWPLVHAWRRLRDRRNRAGLALGRAARAAGLGRPRAVVAACWSFPIHSQTFVYQEMQALAWTGLDCKVFCCDTNARQELPAAFSGLWDKRLVMQTNWAANQRDLEHFLRARPERVDTLLAKLGAATGLTREQLLNESIVRTGFTFARHVELSGARYLHTYFFYDQSLLGLMAAWLLQIPRGITAYADHMLGDYQFKLVPLHLELADIVVATSARIKRELGEIGGGRFDDKIIVKPNGIDAARFPYVDGATRLAMEGIPELIAVNRIEPKKGLIHLVDAIGLLEARGVPVTLNLVGGADKTPAGAECFRQLTARIDELGLGSRVILHGMKQQHEFIPLMARSRLFVAPYVEVDSGDKDGIPTAVLEAMSTGLPIVHTDAGSIEEAAAHGVEGLTVPQRDAAALADAIARLLSDRDLYVRMSHAARQRALSEFDIHVTERRLHERIQAVLSAGPVRA